MSKASKQSIIRNRRVRVSVGLFLGIVRDFHKEARLIRRHGLAGARKQMSTRHRRRAVQFRETALELGGVMIKLGQFFSTRVDIMPPEYIEELARLQDMVPPVPFSEIRKVIESELGGDIEEIFASIDTEPVAAASLAQVHLAVLPDGTRAALKIQRPGIDKLADIDLATFSYLMEGLSRFTRFGRRMDIQMIVSEFVRTVGDELDFLREGGYAERFRDYFSDNKLVYVPKVFWKYTTGKVLALEAVDGIKISDYERIEEAGIDRRRVAQEIIDSYLKQVLEDGFFHADPHPGNLFVAPGPLITFVDFGMIGEVTPPMRAAFRNAVVGIAQRDTNRIIDALNVLGFVRPGVDIDSVKNAFDWLFDHYSSITAQTLTFAEVEEIHDDILVILRDQPITIPAQFAFLGKTISMMIGLATGLDPDIDLIEAVKPYVAKLVESGAAGERSLLADEAVRLGRIFLSLPGQVSDLLDQLRRGKLKVEIDGANIAEALETGAQARFSRTTAAFCAAAVLGGAWLISKHMDVQGYVFAGFGLLAFLFSHRRA